MILLLGTFLLTGCFGTPDYDATFDEVLRYDKANISIDVYIDHEADYDYLKKRIVSALNNKGLTNIVRISIKSDDCIDCYKTFDIRPYNY